jgi:hypothetical protein
VCADPGGHGGERDDGRDGGARLAAGEPGPPAAADGVPRDVVAAEPGAVRGAVPHGVALLPREPAAGAERRARAHAEGPLLQHHRRVPPVHGGQVQAAAGAAAPDQPALLGPLLAALRRPQPQVQVRHAARRPLRAIRALQRLVNNFLLSSSKISK